LDPADISQPASPCRKSSTAATALQPSLENACHTLRYYYILKESYDLDNLSDTLAQDATNSVQQFFEVVDAARDMYDNNSRFETAEETPLAATGFRLNKGNGKALED